MGQTDKNGAGVPAEWPDASPGVPEKPKVLANVPKGALGETMVSLLAACGIPVVRSYPHAGRLANVILGDLGANMALLVPESMYDEAAAIISGGAELLDEDGTQTAGNE